MRGECPAKHLLHHGSPRSWIGSPVLFCSNRRRCRVYTGFVHTSIRLHVHTHIYAQISYTMIANGSNIVLGFVAIVYLGPFLSGSILSAIRRKRIRKEKERTGARFFHNAPFFEHSSFAEKSKTWEKLCWYQTANQYSVMNAI